MILGHFTGGEEAWEVRRLGYQICCSCDAGVKEEPRYRLEIAVIMRQVKLLEKDLQTFVPGELGVTPLWYQEYAEIPGIINKILT